MFETQLPDAEQHPERMWKARRAFALLNDAVARLPRRQPEGPPELDALFIWSALHDLASIMRSSALERFST